ncbi:M20 family metallopeptidase [Candidatus Poribacteria bacterium]|nr:M20 family metallopeptidase [Candidatus Poribacteria bacterium]
MTIETGVLNLIRQTVSGMESEIIDFLSQLVRAKSINPPGDTITASAVIQEKLKEFKNPYEIHSFDDDKPNIILRAGNRKGKSVCFNSHMDTVPVGDISKWKHDPFGAEIVNGKLYGRGSADAKGCAAAMLMAARVLEKAGIQLNGGLDVAIVSDEETAGSIGTQYVLDAGLLKPDLVVTGEITSNRIAIAEKGLLILSLTTHGRTAHASTPWEGVSAISKMAKLINEIENTLGESFKHKRHSLTPPPSFNFGLIEGGVAVNVVPDECRLTMDRRTIPGESLDEAEQEIAGIIERVKKTDPTFDAEFSVVYRANAFETHADSPLVNSAANVCRLMELNPQPVGYQQVSDGRFFADKGIPTIIIGPGVAELAHTPDEYVSVAAVIEATKLYTLLAVELLESADCADSL